MSALTEARNTPELCGRMSYEREVAASKKVYAGSIVAQNSSSKAQPAADAASTVILGRAANTAEAGETVKIETGIFLYDNGTSSAALAATDIGATAYVVDDHTVGKTGGTNSVVAGVVIDVTADGVWVRIGK